MKYDYKEIVNQKMNEFCRDDLTKEIIHIIEKEIKGGTSIAYYGGGNALHEIEKAKIFKEILYVIDAQNINDDRHIFPNQIFEKEIDTIIVLSWYYRSDISYTLHNMGYKGIVIDIFECLKQKGIDLALPWYLYPKQANKEAIILKSAFEVEFYLIDAFEIFQFEYLYNELKKAGVKVGFVAEPCEINILKEWFDYDTAIRILEEKNYEYSLVCNPDAKFAITTQTCGVLNKYKHNKVRYAYGNNMNKQAMSNSEKVVWGFDYSLVAGKWRKQLLSQYVSTQKIVCMGYPKYVKYFQEGINKKDVLTELNITTQKRILIYLPTWGQWTSIKKFAMSIKELKKDYFIITKPHHCTSRLVDEQENRELLNECSDIVLDGNYDFTKAISIGDIFICDALSGSATEAVYLRKEAQIIFVNACESDLLFEDVYEMATVVENPSQLVEKMYNFPKNPVDREIKIKEIFGGKEDNINNVVEIIKEKI